MERSRSNIFLLFAFWLLCGAQGLAVVPDTISFEEDQRYDLIKTPTKGVFALDEVQILKLNPEVQKEFQSSVFALSVMPSAVDRKYGKVSPDRFLQRDERAFLSIHIFPFHIFW